MSAKQLGTTRTERAVFYPYDLQARYGKSPVTVWRWERTGKLPPRDVHVGGELVGWRPATIFAAESGIQAAA